MKRWDLSKTKIKWLTTYQFALLTEQPLHHVNLLISSRQLMSEVRVRKEPQHLIPIVELARYQDGENKASKPSRNTIQSKKYKHYIKRARGKFKDSRALLNLISNDKYTNTQ